MRRLTVAAVFLLLAGCNAYSGHYEPVITTEQLTADPHFIPYNGEPQVRESKADPYQDYLHQLEDGWQLIGTSAFRAIDVRLSLAAAQGQTVKAEQVIVYKTWAGTSSGVTPITTPTTQTSYVAGAVGTTMYNGAVTTFGTRTDYIPYTNTLYEHLATYWVRCRPGGLGAFMRDLETADKQQIGSNKGARIIAIMRNSAAYRADLLPGDIVTEIDGQPVTDYQSARDLVATTYGRTVNFVVFRNGGYVTKPVAVDPDLL